MSISKKLLAVASAAVFMFSAMAAAEPVDAFMDETAIETMAEPAVEPAPAPAAEPAVEPAPAPVVELAAEPAVVPVAEPAAKPKAETEVKLNGGVQYRLREHISTLADRDGNSQTTMDYRNMVGWRLGLNAKIDDAYSMRFQIGNDWSATEGVSWAANNGVRSRFLSGISIGAPKTKDINYLTVNEDGDTVITRETVVTEQSRSGSFTGFQNLYVHLASFRWNPGCFFIEAGVVPLNSNGTLDLLESSLSAGKYDETGFNGWSDINNSLIGLKIGMPFTKEGVKVSAELFQTIIDQRNQSFKSVLTQAPDANPPSALLVLTLPVDAGAFKITPEVTAVVNRNFNSATGLADHEIIGGLAGSYKVNSDLSLNFNAGGGMVSNENSKVGSYGSTVRSGAISAEVADVIVPYRSAGIFLGASCASKAGPGTLQIGLNYTSAENSDDAEKTKHEYIYTDLRYVYKVHDRVSITPRYRTYTTMFPDASANDWRVNNRFELIFEGSF